MKHRKRRTISNSLLLLPNEIDQTFDIEGFSPEQLKDFAIEWLKRRRLLSTAAVQGAMLRPEEDLFDHDAAWILHHSAAGVDIIDMSSGPVRVTMRKVWAHAVQAGARRERMKLNRRYLGDLDLADRHRTQVPAVARAARIPKITLPGYEMAKKTARTRKELFSSLKVSGNAVRAFEKKNLIPSKR